MASIISPNMALVIPTVGQEQGPQYATDVNNSLTLIDQHDHTSGHGVLITTAAINVNADLAINQYNLTAIRSSRYTAQAAPLALSTDLDCLYVSGVDLYYNDGNSNQIRITQSGSIAGTSGSIGGLASPASATYVSATPAFVFQSAANTPANLDGGSLTIRKIVANSPGITLAPSNSLSASYTLTLPPALPASQKILTVDNSGNVAATYDVDNSTLQITSSLIGIKPQGVTQGLLAPRSIGSNVGAGGVARSLSSGNFSATSTGIVPVTNLSVTLVTTGRPVMLMLQCTANASHDNGQITVSSTGSNPNGYTGTLYFATNSGLDLIGTYNFGNGFAGSTSEYPAHIMLIDTIFTPSNPGTYTFVVSANVAAASGSSISVQDCILIAYEL